MQQRVDRCIAELQTIMLIFRNDLNDITLKFEALQQCCSAVPHQQAEEVAHSLHIREQQATGMTRRIHALEQTPVEPLLQRIQQLEATVQDLKAAQAGYDRALAATFKKSQILKMLPSANSSCRQLLPMP
jgi:chromosome segregation ATPase